MCLLGDVFMVEYCTYSLFVECAFCHELLLCISIYLFIYIYRETERILYYIHTQIDRLYQFSQCT